MRERYGGLTPRQVIDFKALCGDTSDNIPGIPGVGPKTASKLLLEFGDLPGIYDHLNQLPVKQAALFEEHRERVFRGQTLVTIVQDAPVDLDLEAAQWGDYNRAEVVEVLKDLEFFSTISRLPPGKLDGPLDSPAASDSPAAPEVETHYTTVQDSASLGELVRVLTESQGFAFDTETAPDGLDVKGVQPMRSGLVGLSFATEAGSAWYVPVGHIEAGPIGAGSGAGGVEACPGGPGTAQGRPQWQTMT